MSHTLATELQERGLVYQFSAEKLEDIVREHRTIYLGIDPTADSIHVGNLVPYMLLTHLVRSGHKVVLLIGGGTGLIGDPSGKSEERPFTDAEKIAEHVQKLEAQVQKLTGADTMKVVNNLDWLKDLSVVSFLRDVGKHFTVNAMIKKESVARRFESEQGISYTEFSYALLQSYDYWHLYTTQQCTLQIGGSDQWGNIASGIDYIRRREGAEVHGITVPLVVDKVTGKKFGKSEGNAVWIDAEKTSPYAFYQFWLNTSDENLEQYLKIFTFLPLSEIALLIHKHQDDPGARHAQRTLAREITTFVHGAAEADSAAKVTDILFDSGDLESLQEEERAVLLANAPTYEVTTNQPLVEILVDSTLASSKREARTFIESGAITLDGEKITDVEMTSIMAPLKGGLGILRRGKKQVVVLIQKA